MFKLKNVLARDVSADLDDVLSVKVALKRLGFYERPNSEFTKYPDEQLFEGIESFQQKFGLRKDGIIRPRGPTERTFRALGDLERNSDTGPFVSSIAFVDAAVVIETAVAVNSTVTVAGAGSDN